MQGRTHTTNARIAPRTTKFTMQDLRRVILWGCVAATALLFAVATTHTDVGSQRASLMLSSFGRSSASQVRPGYTAMTQAHPPAPDGFDAEAVTSKLAATVRNLSQDRDRLTARLAAIEQNMDDITGSITRQIDAVKREAAQSAQPRWSETDTAATSISVGTTVVPVAPPAGLASLFSLYPPSGTPAPTPEAALSIPSQTSFAVDLGGALSIKTLEKRWTGLRSARPQLLEGLQAVATLREIPQPRHVELRLLLGPLPSAETAAHLCTSLAAMRLSCQPTTFDGPHLVLE